MISKIAQCQRAHEHSASNTYESRSGIECRECRRYRWRTWWRRHHGTLPGAYKVITEPEEHAERLASLSEPVSVS